MPQDWGLKYLMKLAVKYQKPQHPFTETMKWNTN